MALKDAICIVSYSIKIDPRNNKNDEKEERTNASVLMFGMLEDYQEVTRNKYQEKRKLTKVQAPSRSQNVQNEQERFLISLADRMQQLEDENIQKKRWVSPSVRLVQA
jgi:hypothetical protein